MRIKEVETLVGITKKNIRFYEKEGLLSPGREEDNSYRDYSEEDVKRLKQIKLLRKLNMPLCDILEILDGKISLSAAARSHSMALEEQIVNIGKSRKVCDMIAGEIASINEIDTELYLSSMETMEKEGAVFMNIRKNDVIKKYFGPVAACVIVVMIAAAIIFGFYWLYKFENLPLTMFAVLAAIFAIVALGTVSALITRIREIRGGEEDDLGKY